MGADSLHWVLFQDFCLTRKLELSQMDISFSILWGGSGWMVEQPEAFTAVLDVNLIIAQQCR